MSVVLPVLAIPPGAAVGMWVAASLGAPEWFVPVGGLAGAVFGVALWAFSPLPSSNGGMFAPPARKQQWGFTTEPAKDYEEPDGQDMLSTNPFGINWAEEEGDND